MAKKCLITPRHRCYFTQSSNGGVGEGGREGEEYCVFSIRIISLLSSLSLSSAAAAAAAGSTSSVRSFARPPVVPQTPLISFQDRSMTFCYAPQVQAAASALLPSFPLSLLSGGFCGQTVIRARSRRPLDHLVRQVKCLTIPASHHRSEASGPVSTPRPSRAGFLTGYILGAGPRSIPPFLPALSLSIAGVQSR